MTAPDAGVIEQDTTDEASDEETDKPPKWHVILHNDDYTTMEFVTRLLRQLFHKAPSEAERIMRKVHNEGEGVAGTYSKEIAETKVEQGTQMAREEGHPLQLTAEPAEDD